MVFVHSGRRQHEKILTAPERIDNTSVLPVSSVSDLGVYLDDDLTMTAHVNSTVRARFAALRQLRSVRRSLCKRAITNTVKRRTVQCAVIGCKLKQNANEGCNSCASLAGLVLSFIACFILLVIAP